MQHAGEIYGERAILATEVRELQSRLLSLCDERDRSLAVLDEVLLTLASCSTRMTISSLEIMKLFLNSILDMWLYGFMRNVVAHTSHFDSLVLQAVDYLVLISED